MRLTGTVIVGLIVFVPPALEAQQPAAGDPLTSAMRRHYEGVARNLREAAEKMPDDKYGYQPSKDVRTFAQLIGHVADYQFISCSQAKGAANPNKEAFEKVTSKAALVKAITDGITYCTSVWSAANDKWLLELTAGGRGPGQPRAAVLAFNSSHSNEHYGNIVTYMRLNDLVPPSTERFQQPPAK